MKRELNTADTLRVVGGVMRDELQQRDAQIRRANGAATRARFKQLQSEAAMAEQVRLLRLELRLMTNALCELQRRMDEITGASPISYRHVGGRTHYV